jgi:hypothetical protein
MRLVVLTFRYSRKDFKASEKYKITSLRWVVHNLLFIKISQTQAVFNRKNNRLPCVRLFYSITNKNFMQQIEDKKLRFLALSGIFFD